MPSASKIGFSVLFMVGKGGEGELEVKSLVLEKPHYKSLAFKDTCYPYKILVSLSLRDRVKCGVLGGKGGGGQFLSLR